VVGGVLLELLRGDGGRPSVLRGNTSRCSAEERRKDLAGLTRSSPPVHKNRNLLEEDRGRMVEGMGLSKNECAIPRAKGNGFQFFSK